MNRLPKKVSLARIPTPIEPLSRLSDEWNIDLRIKRDDLTGADLSGNKIRKLEYLLQNAIEQGCDTIVTCGATTSNHARATAIAARRLGLNAHLILAGEPPDPPHGNLQLDLLVGATVEYISLQDYTSDLDRILQRTIETLDKSGKKAYPIPVGGANDIGIFGYFEAAREIHAQCREMNWFPDYIACAVGSGGTYAGLFWGNAAYPSTENVLGFLVCGTMDYFRDKIVRDIHNSSQRFNIDIPIDPNHIQLFDSYIGEGYGKTDSNQLRFIQHVALREGIILDPVYTGKCFYGLVQKIQQKEIPKGSKIMFIHTGGIFGLSAFTSTMANEWKSLTCWNNYA